MYTGNGVTTEFPLSGGAGGGEVWLTPPGGDAIRMEKGTAYTVSGGAVFFNVPPPSGWTVSFEKPEGTAAMTGGYVVVYADGTMRTVSGDPAEMLEQAQTMLTAAKAEREALVKTIAAKAAEITVLAETVKDTMTDRLLNHSALAEKIIAAAAVAVKDDVLKQTAEAFDELRAGQKNVMSAREEIRAARKAVLDAVQRSANEAAKEAQSEVHGCCKEALEAYERIRVLTPELESLTTKAKNAAELARQEVLNGMAPRCEALLDEIRAVRARLERDVIQETDREERRRNEALEDMRRIRDETAALARAMARIEGRVLSAANEAAGETGTTSMPDRRRSGRARRIKEEREENG